VSAREDILRALRAAAPAELPRPEVRGLAAPYADRVRRFEEAVAAVAGTARRVPDGAALAREVSGLAASLPARTVASAVPEVPGNVALDALPDPHGLEGIDLAVLPGAFGVAENGAVWVPGEGLGRHRGVFVVCQHLALVVLATAIANDMHEAVARLAAGKLGFGTFVAGPSKTADIEQALVIGAHGARSCTVFVVG
jgi:L-lactate dehydrogenase complex protein LldG